MATRSATRSVVTTAMAIAGRASRACDVCMVKGAGWYCAADAAYLCDRCDTQVHSANSLAQRHERVRLNPSGTPMKPPRVPQESPAPKDKPPASSKKKATGENPPPPQVPPSRKRSRTSRPHPHRRADAQQACSDEVKVKVMEDATLFADFFDTEDFLVDDAQEVPASPGSSLSPSVSSPSSGSEYSPEFAQLSPELMSFHNDLSSSPSADSFAAYLKGKAAHEEFLVPDTFDSTGIDSICCGADGSISLPGDVCFVPGDIPGLEVFDDCSLSFNLAQRGVGVSPDTFHNATNTSSNAGAVGDAFSSGPFAKYFVRKRRVRAESSMRKALSPEVMKSEAKEILRCCLEGEAERAVPTLRLNYDEVITAWSNRGEPWVNPGDSASVGAGGIALTPQLTLVC